MKKVILTGVALMAFAAAGFAQANQATVNQAGDDQIANAQQFGNAQVSNIQQTEGTSENKGNKALTIQGTAANPNTTGINTAEIFQRNGAQFNEAGATQSGKGNLSTITQDASGGTVLRGSSGVVGGGTGDGNFAGTLQEGSDNTAVVNQSGTGGSTVKANFGEVYQYGTSNKGTILQGADASDNAVTIKQGTTSLDVTKNEATVEQNVEISTENTVLILQTGDNGKVNVGQRNNSGSNTTNVNQVSGNGSEVSVQQNFGAFRNQTDVIQYGNNHVASVEQVASSDNEATINQGSASTASLKNKARIYQKDGSQEGKVTINQNVDANGGNNFALVEQAYPLSGNSTGNEATINQEGSLNSVRLSQTGVGDNTAMIGQTGNGNIVDGPGSSLFETGPMAIQTGDNNSMDVNQISGTDPAVFNKASISQSGVDNVLTLDQTATTAGNTSTVTQLGSTNQAIVQQNGVMP